MMYRAFLFAAASAVSLWANVSAAQTAAPGGAPAASEVEAVVVTGSRAVGRSRLDTLAPVDVIGAQSLAKQGVSTELAQALANLTPALDFPRPAITDGTDSVRPAVLRGLDPDQTLVLVNGMRGHVSALVNVNGSIGRGSTEFDLNTIPTVAVNQVEVLRDGASAQYGSDAIAGVVNIRLREARSGGGITANYGIYDTDVTTSRGERKGVHDGLTESVAGWQGLPLGKDGFLTVSGEYVLRHPTNRSDFSNIAVLPNYGRALVLGRYGDPLVRQGTVYANAGLPLDETWSLYANAGYQNRKSTSAATARAYNNSGNVPAVYPGGFLPKIHTDINDYSVQGGVKGEVGGYHVDLGGNWGRNTLHYRTIDSINASFGAASPHEFDAGELDYDQWLVNLNVSKTYDVGLVEPLNVAGGLEYRHESFGIKAGEPASYTLGPDTTKAGVSQGFPGFRPGNALNVSRHNWAAYLDFEGKLTEQLGFDVAGRYEDYSDFGSKATGKVSARYDFSPALALRGSVSSGFRAPALQQQYFTYTSTNNTLVGSTFQLIEVGTFPVSSPVSVALGAKPLRPETSMNYSLGGVFRQGRFELTVDAYQIDMKNRIVLSESLPNNNTPASSTAIINAILGPLGISQARFFINGVNTTTRGVDVVARYRWDTDATGQFDFTLAGNYNHTKVTKTPALSTLSALPQPAFLFDRGNVLTLEKGTPRHKIVANVDWTLGDFGATLKATNYGNVLIPNNTASFDYNTGAATLVDFEGRYTFHKTVGLALGVTNLFDHYPHYTPSVVNSPTGSIGFPSYSPYGFNGRFFYGRISYNW